MCYKCDGINGESVYVKGHCVINVLVWMENYVRLGLFCYKYDCINAESEYVKCHCVINVMV